MAVERVGEALEDRGSEGLQISLGQVERRHDLVEERLAHVGAHRLVGHAVAHDLVAGQVRAQHHGGVRAVEHADLAQLVRGDVLGEDDVAAGLLEGQLILDPGRALDDPQAERLGGVEHVVLVADFRPDLLGLAARIAGHDAVHQRGAEDVLLHKPGLERIAEVPLVGGLEAALLEVAAVVVDQLARQQDEAGALRAAERGEALIQQAGQLAGEGGLGLVVKAVLASVDDAGLGGVGDDETHVLVVRQREVALEVLVRGDAALHALDDAGVLHGLAVNLTAQDLGIQAVLRVEHADHAALDGLHDDHARVHAGRLVGLVDHPVAEGAQEAALAKLNHALGLGRDAARHINGRECRSIQLNHVPNLPVNLNRTTLDTPDPPAAFPPAGAWTAASIFILFTINSIAPRLLSVKIPAKADA